MQCEVAAVKRIIYIQARSGTLGAGIYSELRFLVHIEGVTNAQNCNSRLTLKIEKCLLVNIDAPLINV